MAEKVKSAEEIAKEEEEKARLAALAAEAERVQAQQAADAADKTAVEQGEKVSDAVEQPPTQPVEEQPVEQEQPAPRVRLKQEEELDAILESQGIGLKYDISEVMSKVPNNKGYGVMDGKVMFVSQDEDLLDANEVMRTMDASYTVTKELYGEPTAKIAQNAVARSADQQFKFGPEDIYKAFEATSKTSGYMSPDYESGSSVDVVRQDENFQAASMIVKKIGRTISGQIQSGGGFNDAVSYGLAMMQEDEAFTKLGDSAKSYYAKQIISMADGLRSNLESGAVVKQAEAWNRTEQAASQKVAQKVALLSEDFSIQATPEEKLKYEADAKALLDNSNTTRQQEMKLTQAAVQAEREINDLRRNYPQLIESFIAKGLPENEANIAAQRTIADKETEFKQIRESASMASESVKTGKQLAEKALSYATKGLPYAMKAEEIQRIGQGMAAQVTELSNPIELSKALSVSDRYRSTFSEMNGAEQYAFFLEHGLNEWLVEAKSTDPKKFEISATIRDRIMDQFRKTGSVAGIAPELHEAITGQVKTGIIKANAKRADDFTLEGVAEARTATDAASRDLIAKKYTDPNTGKVDSRVESALLEGQKRELTKNSELVEMKSKLKSGAALEITVAEDIENGVGTLKKKVVLLDGSDANYEKMMAHGRREYGGNPAQLATFTEIIDEQQAVKKKELQGEKAADSFFANLSKTLGGRRYGQTVMGLPRAEKAESAMPPPAPSAEPKTVIRSVNGKQAVFNAETKEFIKWQ